jgi:hypothetical protein
LLWTKEKLVEVLLPVIVEALEAVWGETDRGCGCEVEASRVEEIEERVLQNLFMLASTELNFLIYGDMPQSRL